MLYNQNKNEYITEFYKTSQEQRQNIYRAPSKKMYTQEGFRFMDKNITVYSLKIEELSYQDLKQLNDTQLRVALQYLHQKYGSQRNVSKHLKIGLTTLNSFEQKRYYGLVGKESRKKTQTKDKPEAKAEAKAEANVGALTKFEYEVSNTSLCDIKNLVNIFLRQADTENKYNISFRITKSIGAEND